MTRPRVLMITGVYHPETSGASLQCRQLIANLRPRVDFEVLTTSADSNLPRHDVVDGVNVRRIFVDPSRPLTKGRALLSMTAAVLKARSRFDILHLHGFSQKNMLLVALARLLRKKTVMKLTSVGHDDAITMRRRGGVAYTCYRSVDHAIAVSPALERAWRDAALEPARVGVIPNAVDLDRFRPATASERQALKREHGWALELPVVLFVGFFSREKRPDVLYRAWAALWEEGVRSTLVLVGASRSAYYEVDSSMAEGVRADARRRGLESHLVFVEHTKEIERYYRAADVFALPTTREGLPNVLLESMASGVPPVISSLPGVTDWIVEDGVTGRLVATPDEAGFARALRAVLASPETRQKIGAAARVSVEQQFTQAATAAGTLDVYTKLLARRDAR